MQGLRTSEAINELAAALSKAQGEMEGAKKDSENPFFRSKYADLASVWAACREPLTKYGLAIVQFPKSTFLSAPEPYEWTAKSGEKRYGVRVVTEVAVLTRILHASGQWMEDAVSAMLSTGDPQEVAKATTYLRRIALQSVAGVAPEDDDGEGAATHGSRPERQHETRVAPGPRRVTPEVVDAPVDTDLRPAIPGEQSPAWTDAHALGAECLRLSGGDRAKAGELLARIAGGVTTVRGLPASVVIMAWGKLDEHYQAQA